MKTKGWIILATNSVDYYKMALNLAISLRTNNTEVGKEGTKHPICLVCCGHFLHHFTGAELKMFDQIRKLKPEHVKPFYTKTVLNLYTPYDESIYLDCDSLSINSVDYLFDTYAGSSFATLVNAAANRSGVHKIKFDWAKGLELYDYYQLPDKHVFHELNSSLMYWDSSQKAKDIFTLAEYFYAEEYYTKFNGLGPRKERRHFPDELAFEVAMLHINHMIEQRHEPFYMAFKSMRYQGWTHAAKHFCLFTMPGAEGHSHTRLWNWYKALTGANARQMRLPKQKLRGKVKAASGLHVDGIYKGLREFTTRPKSIKDIIKKYNK